MSEQVARPVGEPGEPGEPGELGEPVGVPAPQDGREPGMVSEVAWQRLDPRMLLVHPVRELLRFLPALFVVVVAGGRGGSGLGLEFYAVGVPVVLGLLRYLTTTFRVADGRVELRRGLLSRHTLSAPVDRVRTVDLTASPVHRLVGLTTVRIGTGSTAGDHDDELDLDGLPVARARTLRRDLLARSVVASPGATGAAPGEGAAPRPADVVLAFDPRWLRLAPLTGTGLVVAAAAVGAGFQFLNNLGLIGRGRRVDPDAFRLPMPLAAAVSLGVVLAVIAVSVLSVLGYLVAYGGFTLTAQPGAWRVRRGLLTVRESSLDVDRVAGVSLHEPRLLRWAGAASLSAIVTGIDRKQETSAVLAPPSPLAVSARTADVVLERAGVLAAPLRAHGPAATRRRWVRALAPAAVLAAGLLVLVPVTGSALAAIPAVLVLLVGVGLAHDRSLSLGHALVAPSRDGAASLLVARSGSLLRRRDVLGTEHVIGWTLRASWFQRRAGLVTLVATTAGGRQFVQVLDVPAADAVALADAAVPGLLTPFLV